MATKRQQEDMQLVFNALLTLSHCTDYDIAWKNCEMVYENDDIFKAVSAIYATWASEELAQALATNGAN